MINYGETNFGILIMGIISGLEDMAKKAMGFGGLKKNAQGIRAIASGLVVTQRPVREETFEEALIRLNLTEQDIEKRESEFKRLVIIFALIGLGVLLYFIYAVTQKAWIASLGSIGIFLVVLAQLFRYHFWLFQIRQKRLGCTFKEWLRDLVSKKTVGKNV